MPIEITMPRLSDTMESGTVIKWDVSEGDVVSSGDVVADVETDKATMELAVFDDGTMAKILIEEGRTVAVGTLIAVLAEEDEDVAEVAASALGVKTNGEAAEAEVIETEPTQRDRLRISPVARRLAEEAQIDIAAIAGSGPSGRIIKRDVLKALEAAKETAASIPPSAAPVAHEQDPVAAVPTTQVPLTRPRPTDLTVGTALQAQRVALTNMRQTIARRLVESKTTIPHYQVSMTFSMDPLLQLRGTLNEQLKPTGVKLSITDFLVRCCALAMYQHPDFNASWDDDAVIIHGRVNIGIAISVGPERGGGLVVGVIQDADQKSLRTISHESKQLAEKARTRGLTVVEMTGATFTISNLGMFGVDQFNAIINPPNSAILAVGAAIEKPVVRDGQLTIGREMSATLSCDHRVIDGAMGAQYLQTLKQTIENPATLLV